MKKIRFEIDEESFWVFIEWKLIKKISEFAGEQERIGYLFANKVKDTNEFRCVSITTPQKQDISTNIYSEMSKKHQKLSKRIQKKNKYLYEIGFYHTHPKTFGCKPSDHDLQVFKEKSLNYSICLFIIAINTNVNYFIYSFGKKIKEGTWII